MSFWQEVSSKESWDEFVAKESSGSFLQAFEFGDFHQSLGKKVWRLGLGQSGLTGVCLLIKESNKFGNFIYSPGGPLLTKVQDLGSLIKIITQLGKEEKVGFVRFDPRLISEKLASEISSYGLKQVNNFTQPQCTQIIDLTKEWEEIRAGFSRSTRYNLSAVERKGVRVSVSDKVEDIKIFENLLHETAQRQGFRLHAQASYYKKQFEAFAKTNKSKLYLAREPQADGHEILAAAIVIYFGSTVTYLHAASSRKNPKLRASYLMQWKIIQDAKNSGARKYDFWGISANETSSDPWAGVTIFKKGFGGEKICYSPPSDLVLSKGYYLDSILEKARLIIRKWR